MNYQNFEELINNPEPDPDAFGKIQVILENWKTAFQAESDCRGKLAELFSSKGSEKGANFDTVLEQRGSSALTEIEEKNRLIFKCGLIR